MTTTESRSFDKADEVRTPDLTTVEVVRFDDGEVARTTFQPGWRWSECIKPVVKTDLCMADHLGYAVSGRLRVEHSDGTAFDVEPGGVYRVAPGHDAWVLGDEQFVGVEFKSAATYAKG